MENKDTTKVISVRLDENDLVWMNEYAKEEDLSISQIIRKSLKNFKKENIDK